MPKQPNERRRRRNRANRSTNANSNADPLSNPPSQPVTATFRPEKSDRKPRALVLRQPDPEERRQEDLQRLTRSPLQVGRFGFVSPDLVLKGFALGSLLFSFIGALSLSQHQLSWLQILLYTVLMGIIAAAFVYSTQENKNQNTLICLAAIGIETVATVAAVLLIGFSAPMYFTILPFYVIAGHIQASFDTRPALGLSGLLWLIFFAIMATTDDPIIQGGLVILVLMLSIPFFGVTLVVRFIIREGRQRQHLVEALENLKVSEERYRQVTDQANDVIFTLDEEGTFSFINPKMIEATGYNEEELLRLHFTEILANESRSLVGNLFRNPGGSPGRPAKTERKSRLDQTILSLELIRKDGSKVLTEVTLAPITNDQGGLSGWVGIARDVTERTRMRAQVERRNRDLSALNAVTSAAGQSLELERLLNDVVTTLVDVLRADVAGITLIEEETRLLKVGAYKGMSDMVVRAVTNASITENESLTRSVATTGQPLLIYDMTQDKRAADNAAVQSIGLRAFAAAPIKTRDRLLGVVSLISHQKGAFQQDDLDLLVSIGNSLAVAIENARLYGTSLSQVREMTCLAEIARAINLSESLGQTLTNIAESISLTLNYKSCAISLIEADQLFIRAYGSYGMPPGFLERINRLAQEGTVEREELMQLPIFRALEANGPVVYKVGAVEGKLAPLYQEALTQNWAMVLTVPLYVSGRVAGVITCYSTETTPPPESELRLLTTIANQTSLAVQNAELFREQQRRADQLRAVSEIGRRIGSILSVDELLPFITRLLQQTFDYYLVAIYLVDSDNLQDLVLRAIHGWNLKLIHARPGARMPRNDQKGLVVWASNSGEAVIVPDVTVEPRYVDYGEKGMVKSEMVVPIRRGAQVIGVIDLASTLMNGFDEIDLATMQALAEQVTIALENARLYTEVNRVVIQLTNANVELEEATRHKSEFLANMSHELRTPLNAIIGFSEVLQDKVFGDMNDKQLRYVNNILTSGRHLLTLVNDVLDLAKVEAGRMELFPEEFTPDDAINDVEAIVAVSAVKKSLTIQNHFQAGRGLIRADKSKYKQILYNLLSNAVKFTPEKGRITVGNYLHREKGQDYIAIWVKDTGIGIRKEDTYRIFEEFRQVDSSYSRQHQGTGLGLALSKRLVELHNGRIWVDSEPGVGSLFTFTLPVSSVTTQAPNVTPAPTDPIDRLLEVHAQNQLLKDTDDKLKEDSEPSATQPNHNGSTTPQHNNAANNNSSLIPHPSPLPPPPLVLVIDDNDRAAEILAIYLGEAGYRTEQARSGQEALGKVETLDPPPALITLDLMLPDQSGWEVLRDLKASPTCNQIPVLVITIADQSEARQPSGAYGFISKPVIKATLLEMVAEAIAATPSALKII